MNAPDIGRSGCGVGNVRKKTAWSVRWFLGGLAALALAWGPALALPDGGGVVLIMVEEAGCRFCLRWDAEVGRHYAASAEGRQAPLRRVKRGAAELAPLAPVIYTPTFILAQGSRVGRITGYPGESYFWEELEALLSKASSGRT